MTPLVSDFGTTLFHVKRGRKTQTNSLKRFDHDAALNISASGAVVPHTEPILFVLWY